MAIHAERQGVVLGAIFLTLQAAILDRAGDRDARAAISRSKNEPIEAGMRHIIANVSDVPVAPPLVDRRRGGPDRRTEWRGGRRDSDWINRPPDGLARLEAARQHPSALRRMMSSLLHLW